jgi:hypothetical protein
MLRAHASVRVGLVLVAFSATVSVFACGTDPVGVDSCRKIEHARCENAPSCGISLERPVHRGETDSDAVGACKRYYDDACLHGLVAPEDPGALRVDECIEAIHTGTCEIVRTPEIDPRCSFLIPPAPPPPAPVDAADAADGG